MRRFIRFLRLPPGECLRTAEAVVAVGLAYVLLKALPSARVLSILGFREGASPGRGGVDEARALAVSRALARAARNLPFQAVCLPQALAAALMLRRRGLAAEVHFGVAKRDGDLHAHAWSRCGDVVVSGGHECGDFAPISVFRA